MAQALFALVGLATEGASSHAALEALGLVLAGQVGPVVHSGALGTEIGLVTVFAAFDPTLDAGLSVPGGSENVS